MTYEPGTGSIHVKNGVDPKTGRATISVSIWHPQDDQTAMVPYEVWFWKELRRAMQGEAEAIAGKPLPKPDFDSDDLWAVRESYQSLDEQTGGKLPTLHIERAALGAKPLDIRSAVATGMVVFALYFACVYLLPTLNCEERESRYVARSSPFARFNERNPRSEISLLSDLRDPARGDLGGDLQTDNSDDAFFLARGPGGRLGLPRNRNDRRGDCQDAAGSLSRLDVLSLERVAHPLHLLGEWDSLHFLIGR